VDHAGVVPVSGIYAPLFTPSGVAAFSRDRGCTEEVWSGKKGFPGDPEYREFYRDIGHDLDYNYIKPFIPGPDRADTGIKYWRITGRGAHKEPYDPHRAVEKAAWHAGIFLDRRMSHIEHLARRLPTPPVITATFDAELFGHWWYEGPQWLDFLIRKIAFDQSTVQLVSALAYLDDHPAHQLGSPCASSWGSQGTFEVWCNGKTDWILSQVSECTRRLTALATAYGAPRSSVERRALNQCARELLLAQSSDWPFIITMGTSVQYAVRRVRDHVSRFHALADALERDDIDQRTLAALEYLDRVFPDIDYTVFA
jgi:1,4-alpha-glucan branching enzyme